jgi:predicted Rossmann fold flavoprotein
MDDQCDIAVIGAGAAGLATGIFAAEAAARRVVVLDGAAKIGAKILISGGGRCNVTHDVVRPDDFNGARPVVRNILAAFDAHATQQWFASLGVPLKREETGKLFPVSDSARTVLDALLRRCAALGIEIREQHRVSDVILAGRGTFDIVHQHGRLRAARVIMATGGCSLPRTGSDGSGWEIVRRLGHTVTPTFPALVPLVLQGGCHAALSGLSQPVDLSTLIDGVLIDRRTGSLLWTHFGISGPVVMDASRHWVIAHAAGRRVEMRCTFLLGHSFEQVERLLIDATTVRPRASMQRLLGERLPDRLATALLAAASVDPGLRAAQLSRLQRRALVHTLTGFVLPVACARGWDFAEVTAGGVPLAEIDYRSMASRRVAGLHLVGEMLDCDGRIGGFNFQWAWATGFVAGRAAAALGAAVRGPEPSQRVIA